VSHGDYAGVDVWCRRRPAGHPDADGPSPPTCHRVPGGWRTSRCRHVTLHVHLPTAGMKPRECRRRCRKPHAVTLGSRRPPRGPSVAANSVGTPACFDPRLPHGWPDAADSHAPPDAALQAFGGAARSCPSGKAPAGQGRAPLGLLSQRCADRWAVAGPSGARELPYAVRCIWDWLVLARFGQRARQARRRARAEGAECGGD
jgi:hypothetical protein